MQITFILVSIFLLKGLDNDVFPKNLLYMRVTIRDPEKKKNLIFSIYVYIYLSQSERFTRLFERIYSFSKHTINNDAERDNRE